MTEQAQPTPMVEAAWIATARARGYAPALQTLLDILQPVSPVAAQVMWVLQPMGRVVGWHTAIGDLAAALETHEGIAALRHALRQRDEETQ